MVCEKCGMNLEEDALFCRYCGQITFMPIVETKISEDSNVHTHNKQEVEVTSNKSAVNDTNSMDKGNGAKQKEIISVEQKQSNSFEDSHSHDYSNEHVMGSSIKEKSSNKSEKSEEIISNGQIEEEPSYRTDFIQQIGNFCRRNKKLSISVGICAIIFSIIIGIAIVVNIENNKKQYSKRDAVTTESDGEEKINSEDAIENKSKGLSMENDSFPNQNDIASMNHQEEVGNSQSSEIGKILISDDSQNEYMENTTERYSWNLDGAHEGPLPDDIYEQIRGTFYSDVTHICIVISSPSKIIWEDGGYHETEYINGCDTVDNKLLIYISPDGYSEGIILSIFKDKDELRMNTMEGGGWDYEKTHERVPLTRVSNEAKNEYIIPYSSERILTELDIRGFSNDELRKARNEIVARHGRRFKDPELQAYFDEQSWYYGDIDPDDFDRNVSLSDIEQKNMDFIKKFEK